MQTISVGTSLGERPEVVQRDSNADPAVWLWVGGATDVNAGNNFFADFIRDWTSVQFEARYGQNITSPDGPNIDSIQQVSNRIAERFATDIIQNGVLPDISRTGRSMPMVCALSVT